MKKGRRGINPASTPSGNGCFECLASPKRWWFHLRRCAECGHIGCCDSSPSHHASKHAATTGHPSLPASSRVWIGFMIMRSRDDQGRGAASAAFASRKSTSAWTGRESSRQLGIIAALTGMDLRTQSSLLRILGDPIIALTAGVINPSRLNVPVKPREMPDSRVRALQPSSPGQRGNLPSSSASPALDAL